MGVAGKLKGLLSHYRQGGVGEVLLRLSAYGYLPKAVFFLTACHVFVLGPLNSRSLARPLHGYRLERAHPESLDELMACQGDHPETPRAFLASLFDAGHECFVARHADRVAGYFWTFKGSYLLRFDEDPRHALTFTLPERSVFFGNGFIARDHRLRGVFPHLVEYVASQYPDGRCFSSVHHTNLGSLQAHRRVGFLPLLTVACTGIGPLTAFYRSTHRLRPLAVLGYGKTTIEIADSPGAPGGERPADPGRQVVLAGGKHRGGA